MMLMQISSEGFYMPQDRVLRSTSY